MEDEYGFMLWYFDEKYSPTCSSFWEDYKCEGKPNCMFSHSTAKYQANIPILSEVSDSFTELYYYISNYVNINLTNPDSFEEIKIPESSQDEKDQEKINILIKEMENFELGPDISEKYAICPMIKETGNCVIIDLCQYAHSEDDPKIREIEKTQEWYPGSMDCACCKGHCYGCSASECRKNGHCLVCAN